VRILLTLRHSAAIGLNLVMPAEDSENNLITRETPPLFSVSAYSKRLVGARRSKSSRAPQNRRAPWATRDKSKSTDLPRTRGLTKPRVLRGSGQVGRGSEQVGRPKKPSLPHSRLLASVSSRQTWCPVSKGRARPLSSLRCFFGKRFNASLEEV
jgi:hypothetical protein